MTKPTKCVCAQQTQISLGIHPDWSESSLSAWRNLGSLATHWAHSKDSDQTWWMPKLICVFAGRTLILFLSCRGSLVSHHYVHGFQPHWLHVSRPYEPSHKIMFFFVLRKLIFQKRMHSHPLGLNVWFLVRPFVYFHTSCVWTAKALVRLCRCADWPEASLVAYLISTITSWAGSYYACG